MTLPADEASADPSRDASPAPEAEADPGTPDWDWALPGRQGSPAVALARIQRFCESVSDLYAALVLVQGTHQAVTRDLLAAAIKTHRRDLDDLSREQVAGLLTAVWNGGRDGFDATLRARRKGDRRAAALAAWSKD